MPRSKECAINKKTLRLEKLNDWRQLVKHWGTQVTTNTTWQPHPIEVHCRKYACQLVVLVTWSRKGHGTNFAHIIQLFGQQNTMEVYDLAKITPQEPQESLNFPTFPECFSESGTWPSLKWPIWGTHAYQTWGGVPRQALLQTRHNQHSPTPYGRLWNYLSWWGTVPRTSQTMEVVATADVAYRCLLPF